jgi:glycosyl transferase family 25
MAGKQVRRTVVKRKLRSSPLPAMVKKSRGVMKKVQSKMATKRKTARPSQSLTRLNAVVINLKARDDRWKGVQKSVAKSASWLKVDRLDAVDGRIAPPSAKDVAMKWSTERLAQMFHWYRPKVIDMSPGERGCCASHLKAWRKCAAGKKPLIVLEDDAVVLPSFTATLEQALKEAPKDIGALWITSKDRGTRKRFGKVLMEPSYVWTTVGYVMWPAAAKALIKLLPMDMPVDNFMAWHIKQGVIRTFSVSPACVRQANTWNIGSDVPHSDDVALWNYEGP